MEVVQDTPVELGDPDRAKKTLPPGLYISKSRKHGKGVFASQKMAVGLHFGPYEGIKKEVGDPGLDSGYAFEVSMFSLSLGKKIKSHRVYIS